MLCANLDDWVTTGISLLIKNVIWREGKEENEENERKKMKITWHLMLDVEALVMRQYLDLVVHVMVVYTNFDYDHVPILHDRHEKMRPVSH